nr:SDR family NAD(P)-dependent oxidoreductase [Salinispora arenicola]
MTNGGRLSGKVSLITGAAHGIGRATAVWFAREGARLVVSDVDGAALEKCHAELAESGAEVTTVIADVSDSAQRAAWSRRPSMSTTGWTSWSPTLA